MFAPESIQGHIEREEAIERRQAAIRRHHARMQMEMFGPACPNCGEVGGTAVYGSGMIDTGCGYVDDEQRCSLCAGGLA